MIHYSNFVICLSTDKEMNLGAAWFMQISVCQKKKNIYYYSLFLHSNAYIVGFLNQRQNKDGIINLSLKKKNFMNIFLDLRVRSLAEWPT